MTLNEQLTEKKSRLTALEGAIEAGEAEAIKEAEELVDAIEGLEDSIKAAERAQAMLKSIGKAEPAEAVKPEGLKALDLDALKGRRGTTSVQLKAYNDIEKTTDIETVSQTIVDAQPALGVFDIFGKETISGNGLTYFVMGDTEGTIDGTSEGAAKDRVHVPYTSEYAPLEKIAAYIKESDELLEDAAFLESAIRNRLVYELRKTRDAYLVNTLLNTSGIQVQGSTVDFDEILAAKQDIIADTGYTPDAMIINPADLCTLLQSKDSNLQYLLGGPAYGSYGNGAYAANPKIWGLTVVESAAVPQGTAIVGAFKIGAAAVTKGGDINVEVSNSDQDDFIKNLVTVRAEQRLAEAVRIPAAFSVVGGDESS